MAESKIVNMNIITIAITLNPVNRFMNGFCFTMQFRR